MSSPLPTIDALWQHNVFARLAEALTSFSAEQTFIVGCSGGRDSVLLAFLLAQLCPKRVIVAHVNHQLHPDAVLWADLVVKQCVQWQIPCYVLPVQVKQGNIEQQARVARYHALSELIETQRALDPKVKPILALAHHQQDQAETTLLRLFSGSGVRGLAAMKVLDSRQNMTLWRPFLNVPRHSISQLVQQLKLEYVDDPANTITQYDRVYLRQCLWPLLSQRFIGFEANLVRTADLMRDASDILAEVVQVDLQQCTQAHILNITRYQALSVARQRLLLSRWMQGDAMYAPPLASVIALQQEVIQAKADAMPKLVWQQLQFRRHAGQVYRLPLNLPKAQTIQQILEMGMVIELSSGTWQVQSCETGFSSSLLGQVFEFLPKQGGENFHFKGRVGRWLLKKQLQAIGLPTWQREQIQLFYSQGVLLGITTALGFLEIEGLPLVAGGWRLTLLTKS